MKKMFLLVATFVLSVTMFMPNASAAELDAQVDDQPEVSIAIYEDGSFEGTDSFASPSAGQVLKAAKAKKVGTVNFQVNANNRILYNVKMSAGHKFKSFKGTVQVTNLTSGLSHGRNTITGKSGYVQVSRLKNNVFYASLSGMLVSQKDVGWSFDGAHLKWKYKG